MSSELELLEVNFEADIAELKDENTKLRQIIGENARHDAENAEHKARIEELEQILQPRMLNLRLEL